jgi:hypothetical protein
MKAVNTALLIIFSVALISTNFFVPKTRVIAQHIVSEEANKDFNRQLTCLTENIYYEASFQPYEGKLAVAQITVNRVNSGQFPSDICNVVKQKTNGVCQFSWVCKIKSVIVNRYEWQEAEVIARKALTQESVHEALYNERVMFYHATYVHPDWKMKPIMKIGEHIFYK